MNEDNQNDLKPTRVDSAVSLAKGILGAIPYGGSLFAEIIGATIPNQRLDRVVAVLVSLDARLGDVERESLKTNKYARDLFEDGMIQAARSLSEERNNYVAEFIKRSAAVGIGEHSTKKKLLYILQELTDIDIDILHAMEHGRASASESSLKPRPLTVGQYSRLSEDEKYAYKAGMEAWGMHIGTLERLGLIAPEYEKPDFDGSNLHVDRETGLPKFLWHKVTDLGRVFLQSIGKDIRSVSG